jgi:hypothetical protein
MFSESNGPHETAGVCPYHSGHGVARFISDLEEILTRLSMSKVRICWLELRMAPESESIQLRVDVF